MLQWDRVEVINGLSVYGDDDDWTTWYALPQNPRFRVDNGKPVFTFLKYKFPIERSATRKGGGFLVCDVEFGLNEQEEADLREVLQERVEQRWRAMGRNTPAPPAKIGRLSFTRGSASVTVLDSGGALVEKVHNPASPSLYGKMVLPITVELSPEGATLLEQALQGSGGVVQVAYDLWTPVKLPPVRATVWFSATKAMEFHQEIDVEERICAEDDYTEAITELIRESDSGGVDIDPGAVTDQKVIQAVTDWAWQSLAEATTKMVLGDVPIQNPEELRKLYTEQDIENITRDVMSTRMASFRRTFTQGQVMEWNPAPRGTLPNITSMTGPDGEPFRWSDFSRVVDLNDPFFRTMTVAMRVNADFQRLPIHSVELKVEYDPAGQNIVTEPVFTSPDTVETMQAFVANNDKRYTYTYQVNYTGEARSFVSEPRVSNDPSLVINVGDVGVLDLDIAPGDLNFEQVGSAQVSLWYQEGADPRIEASFTLDKQHPTHSWTRVVFAPRRSPVHYRVKYFMVDGREFEGPELTTGASELRINDPFSSTRTINIRGFGDFATRIDAIFLDLSYVDRVNGYAQSHSTALTQASQFEDWSFPAILPEGGELTYTGTIRYKDGTIEPIAQTPVEGSTVMVGDVQLTQAVTVMADLVDFAATRLVKVSLRHVEDGIDESGDLVFKATVPGPLTWQYPYKDRTRRGVSYTATYFLTDGTSATVSVDATTEQTIVLPATAG